MYNFVKNFAISRTKIENLLTSNIFTLLTPLLYFKFGRFTEFADHLHEQFVDPVVVKDGHYQLPTVCFHEITRIIQFILY